MKTFSPVVVAKEAMNVMLNAGREALPRETGGILAGFRTENQVVVTRAMVVTDSHSSRHGYLLQKTRASEELARTKEGATQVVGYVGDWHTHPADSPPSSTDITSFEAVAAAAGDLVALIVVPFDSGKPRPAHARVGRRVGVTRLTRRVRAVTQAVPVTTSDFNGNELERRAEADFDAERNCNP